MDPLPLMRPATGRKQSLELEGVGDQRDAETPAVRKEATGAVVMHSRRVGNQLPEHLIMEASLVEIQKDSSHRFSKLSETKLTNNYSKHTPTVANWGVLLARSEEAIFSLLLAR